MCAPWQQATKEWTKEPGPQFSRSPSGSSYEQPGELNKQSTQTDTL